MTRVGLDIGGSSIKAVAVHPDGTEQRFQSARYRRPQRNRLIQELKCISQGLEIGGGRIESVGLCLPGIRSDDDSRVVRSVNVPGLVGLGLDEVVGCVLKNDVRRFVVGDALAAARDARHRLHLTGRVAGISIGTGVGLAVVDDGGQIVHTDGGAGHLGQVDVRQPGDVPIGPDGGRGGLEAYIGSVTLHERFGPGDRAVLDGLASDPIPMRALAQAMRMVHAMYRPRTIVLLGGLGIRLGRFDLWELVNRDLTSVADPAWNLVFGQDDFHAARGAVHPCSPPAVE